MTVKSLDVFIVDDDDSVRNALKRLLRSNGYPVFTFGSAEEFMHSDIARGKGCVLLDIHLPGMTGLDLQEKLVSMGREHAVIFMTAHDNAHWRERAKKIGGIAYLRKPFDHQLLLDALHLACLLDSGADAGIQQQL